MSAKILQISDVILSIEESNPPSLVIDANGEVSTGGWENGHLEPYIYVTPPAYGIYEFDFVADPPQGIVPQVISPVEAKPYKLEVYPDGLKGVKIYAESNHKIKML